MTVKNEKGERVPKLDDNGYYIFYSNRSMVESLIEQGLWNAESVLQELWIHVFSNGIYFINSSNDEKHCWNMIKITVTRKLCDLTRALKRDPMKDARSINEEKEDEEGSEVVIEFEDESVDVEVSAITADAKNRWVHSAIEYLLNDNKPHRMLCYIGNIANISNKVLYEDIHNNGYKVAIHNIVNVLHTFNIYVDYLEEMELIFPKDHRQINKHYVETAKFEALNQVKNYFDKENSLVA